MVGRGRSRGRMLELVAGKKRRQTRRRRRQAVQESLFEAASNHGKPRKLLIGFVIGFVIILITALVSHVFFKRQVEALFDKPTFENALVFSWASVLGTTGDKIFDIDDSYAFKLMCIGQQTVIAGLTLWAFY